MSVESSPAKLKITSIIPSPRARPGAPLPFLDVAVIALPQKKSGIPDQVRDDEDNRPICGTGMSEEAHIPEIHLDNPSPRA